MNSGQTISLQAANGWAALPSSDYVGNVFSVGPQLRDDPIVANAAL